MPSVFPGMDPFLEGADWEDFHARFITGISDALVPELRPDYVVRTERRIYVENPFGDSSLIRPDLTVFREAFQSKPQRRESASATALLEPFERTLPAPFSVEEKYLIIRRLDSAEVITIIELLSPSNKRSGSEGQEAYLSKREEILQSKTSLVELDLLRGGERMPTSEALPEGDYYALVCRAKRRLTASVYAWPLAHRLPAIPIPLALDDREASLDLQAVFDGAYDRAGYDYSVDYRRTVTPPMSKAEAKWARSLQKGRAKKK